jgi:hypothetical protein
MDEMNITSAQYQEDTEGNNCVVIAVIDGVTMNVPMDTANRHYQAIKSKHDDADDSFTIQDAS